MGRTNYERGAEIEYKIMEILKEMGYYSVRSAGSHGQIDVLGFKNDKVVGIQSKRTKVPLKAKDYLEEIENLKALEQFVPSNMSLEFWVWQDRKGFIIQDVIVGRSEVG